MSFPVRYNSPFDAGESSLVYGRLKFEKGYGALSVVVCEIRRRAAEEGNGIGWLSRVCAWTATLFASLSFLLSILRFRSQASSSRRLQPFRMNILPMDSMHRDSHPLIWRQGKMYLDVWLPLKTRSTRITIYSAFSSDVTRRNSSLRVTFSPALVSPSLYRVYELLPIIEVPSVLHSIPTLIRLRQDQIKSCVHPSVSSIFL